MPYRSETVQQVRKIFEARYKDDIEDSDRRLNELYSKNPSIKDIDREVSSKSIELVRESIRGAEKDREKIDAISSRLDELAKERRAKITALGYPENYSELRYVCDKCKDTGVVDGKMCECFRRELCEAEFQNSGIGKLIKTQSFETFDISFYEGENRENIKDILEGCEKFAREFSASSGKNLLLMGNTGLGKTHLSTSIAKRVIEKGYDVVYDSAQNIFNVFEEVKFRNSTDKDTGIYTNCDLLIIDDLGSEMITSFTVACLYQIINTRINNMMPMIVNTNMTVAQLRESYTDRITSRILGEFKAYEFKGKDNRLQKIIREK